MDNICCSTRGYAGLQHALCESCGACGKHVWLTFMRRTLSKCPQDFPKVFIEDLRLGRTESKDKFSLRSK
eukprot:817462-Pleurochrysis_carterae.AAC.1